MKSIRELYKIGRGPSSSHTMGPERACNYIRKEFAGADKYKIILFGSLSATGKGHGTDVAIRETLSPVKTEIVFDKDTPYSELPHANTMDFYVYKEGKEIGYRRIISVGGGDIKIEGFGEEEKPEVYKENNFKEIADYCMSKNIRIPDYVFEKEGEDIKNFLFDIWQHMKDEIEEGLKTNGILPGSLKVQRVAQLLYNKRHIDESPETRQNRIVCAYAFAAAEQNADCKTIVTAPTCGSCAVVPSVLRYMQEKKGFSDESIIRALATGAVIGNVVKQNASISGAECGCQAEIGTACSMASASLCELLEMGIPQIEYSAEVALEHHLGLTCDPVCGLVQIPCIERNAVAAMRALESLSLANFLTGTRKISFDMVVKTMYETGRDIRPQYRESSEGGLAKLKLS